jgi:hypothetical protein
MLANVAALEAIMISAASGKLEPVIMIQPA